MVKIILKERDIMGVLFQLFNESADIFFEREANNILDDVAERNLCARFAIYLTPKLEKFGLKEYYADPEYNRKQGGQVKTILDENTEVVKIQCDLIIHSRGEKVEMDNLVVIEMKKSTRPNPEKQSDRVRLRAMTKASYDGIWAADGITHPDHVCGYLLGVYMILNLSQRSCVIEYYQHGEIVNQETRNF